MLILSIYGTYIPCMQCWVGDIIAPTQPALILWLTWQHVCSIMHALNLQLPPLITTVCTFDLSSLWSGLLNAIVVTCKCVVTVVYVVYVACSLSCVLTTVVVQWGMCWLLAWLLGNATSDLANSLQWKDVYAGEPGQHRMSIMKKEWRNFLV